MQTLGLSNGYSISGPEDTLDQAKTLVIQMNKEMEQAYNEYISIAGESRAMDERDDIPWEYEDKLEAIGWKLEA